jgi:Domain of unknown function (DUF1824)
MCFCLNFAALFICCVFLFWNCATVSWCIDCPCHGTHNQIFHRNLDRKLQPATALWHLRQMLPVPALLATLILAQQALSCHAFGVNVVAGRNRGVSTIVVASEGRNDLDGADGAPEEQVAEASRLLSDWDRMYNVDTSILVQAESPETSALRARLPDAIRTLNNQATAERTTDAAKGRCMLGICASSASEGVATLKSWVSQLELPRGLLHGMDKDGVPLELNGGVYIKYNSGGVYSFADIRKSQMGFDALWKPGDAMLEEYDGNYRGVYFQVELTDGEFRQYLVPLDVFESVD